MRHILIGDVHGCIDELRALIGQVCPGPSDRLYFIGDLIDRGPDSAGTVRYVRKLAEKFPLILILGNHEEKFLRFLDHFRSGNEALKKMKGVDTFARLAEELDEEEIQFLKASFVNYNIPEEKSLLLHGGIPGNCRTDLSVNYAYSPGLFKAHKGLDLILKTRFLDSMGNFVSIGSEGADARFWADSYDGHYGRIFFGHHAQSGERPVSFTNAINLDTGCVYGGWLSAAVLEKKEITFISIKAARGYSVKEKTNV
jgi:serine/threonine protein phosphatase 1